MNRHSFPRHRLWPILCLLATVGLLLSARPADASIGLYRVSPASGAPGRAIDLSVACGACQAIGVVRGPARPPATLGVSLVPVAYAKRMVDLHAARRHRACNKALRSGGLSGIHCNLHVGPPRDDPFTFLGRAKPAFRERDLGTFTAGEYPEYRLSFRIPRVAPGHYAFVIYTGSAQPGPRGGLIVDPFDAEHLLRVRSAPAAGSVEQRGDATWWIVASAGILILALTGLRLFAHRRSRDRIFS